MVSPLLMDKSPVYRHEFKLNIHDKGNLVYNNEIARQYEKTHMVIDDSNIILVLISWDEISNYKLLDYPLNIKKAGKIWLYFPINNPEYKKYFMYDEFKLMTDLVNRYIKMGSNILIYAYIHSNRAILFIGCCMLRRGTPLSTVKSFFRTQGLGDKYLSYIRGFARYCNKH